jgi:phosphatidylserine/phosphatidylglycerophosphate/cardiolipin synthase-like enzyme
MADPIKRIQTIHTNEQKRQSSSSAQWLLEKKSDTHPISDNSTLKVMICGEEGFADIEKEIKGAKESIDICLWGFDPGMELVRGNGGVWPRGETYGDLLIAAGKRDIKVRLLVWFDPYANKIDSFNPRNMPGYTHDAEHNLYTKRYYTEKACANFSADLCIKRRIEWESTYRIKESIAERHNQARINYCKSWYWAAFNGLFKGVQIRTRAGDTDAVKATAGPQTKDLDRLSLERKGLERMGTHHQKPVLIDFFYQQGSKAVGYVMGLNSVTDYWDTANHHYEDPRRELESARSYMPDRAHSSMKPLRDYACRIDRGRALLALYQNFITAWERADSTRKPDEKSELGARPMPEYCLKKAPAGSPRMQILRTQPDEQDTTIQDLYFHVTDVATRAAGYLYAENQYFQWEEWAQRLLRVRKQAMKQWNASRAGAGLPLEKMPILHVFIVIPMPEKEEMIPRTYDTLATLGQQEGMFGQTKLIKESNESRRTIRLADGMGPATTIQTSVPEVVQYANQIRKQTAITLESQFGIKACTAMLNACGPKGTSFDFREIYIHSKLLLIDDTFFTIGSANMNVRSMVADSEINIATVDPVSATKLRKRIWGELSGNWERCHGGGGSKNEISNAFDDWHSLMNSNAKVRDKNLKIVAGFLLPLADSRSSTSRLG